MAQRVITLLLDDLEGGDADETVTFALDGKTYEIDLTEANAGKLRDGLAPYVRAGRRAGGKSSGGRTNRASARPERAAGDPTPEDLRKWASDNGFEVNARGRVPAAIKEAYAKANG
ncbi:Lsr2 family protein [Streptomyces sp. p1417]|uniref:Lsr2 family protein n=1 Tax=Streptomyces typhae TaxID=2681492 RepID=A0A6L6X0V0_9ACTN|nr:Lsr2 family protein [Streptomyces typhae]MVO87435.1 Lsr2 family protein [Streptomyces typhae]